VKFGNSREAEEQYSSSPWGSQKCLPNQSKATLLRRGRELGNETGESGDFTFIDVDLTNKFLE
jgi:hypothetical protein